MWPDWAGKHFDKTPHDKSLETWQRIGLHTEDLPGAKVIHGHPTTRKIKCVCKLCNNGWMSRLEAAAKASIEPMMLGRRTLLTAQASRTLTDWVVLKMMVWENTERLGTVFTRDQTTAFYDRACLPENVKIWLFRSEGDYLGSRISRAYAGLFTDPSPPPGVRETANTQTAIFGLGQLLIFFVHSQLAELELGETFRQVDAKRLWPAPRAPLVWPPINRMNNADATHIAGMLGRFLKLPGQRPIR